jgi:predicted metal-binding membrane protein
MAELLALKYLLRRDRLIVAVGLAAVVALAWVYLAPGAGIDTSMADMPMDMPMPWSPFYAALMFVMWLVMMIAMMMPGAAPMGLLFTAIKRKQGASVSPFVEAWAHLR